MPLIGHRHFSSINFFLQNAQLLILAFMLIYWFDAAIAMSKEVGEITNGIVEQQVDGGENGEEKNGKDKEEEDWTAKSNEFHLTRSAVETILMRQKRGGSGSLDRLREALKRKTARPQKSSQQAESAEGHRGRILYLSSNKFYSHFQLDLLLVKILRQDGYFVDFFFNNHPHVETPEIDATHDFLFVPVDYAEPKQEEIRKFFVGEFDDRNYDMLVGIFQAFASNQRVRISGKEERIHSWLRKQHYDLGIAEFGICAAAFYIFQLLQIPSISTSAFPPQTALLEMLGIDASGLPDYRAIQPGQTKTYPWPVGSAMYQLNQRNYRSTLAAFNEFKRNANAYYKFAKAIRIRRGKDSNGLTGPEPIDVPFFGIHSMLVNQHPLANFRTMPPNAAGRLRYIGGIVVKEKGILLRKPLPTMDVNPHAACLVLYNMGTVARLRSRDAEGIRAMFRAMGAMRGGCRFLVRIDPNFVPENYDRQRIDVTNEFIDQQEVLSRPSVQGFISHCGQNSLTEAIYAGVPLICLPFGGDQPYNSSLVEYLGIGIWLGRDRVQNEIKTALGNLLAPRSVYQKNAIALGQQVRDQISSNPGVLKRNILLRAVQEAINRGGGGDGGGVTSGGASSSGGGGAGGASAFPSTGSSTSAFPPPSMPPSSSTFGFSSVGGTSQFPPIGGRQQQQAPMMFPPPTTLNALSLEEADTRSGFPPIASISTTMGVNGTPQKKSMSATSSHLLPSNAQLRTKLEQRHASSSSTNLSRLPKSSAQLTTASKTTPLGGGNSN